MIFVFTPWIALCTEGAFTLRVGSAPAAAPLFNDGLWRGACAGLESSLQLPRWSPLFNVPLSVAVGAEYFRPTASSVSLLDDYRGWVVRGSLLWYATDGISPYLRLGGGLSLGERYVRTVEWDTASPLKWHRKQSFIVFWGVGMHGMVTEHIGWNVEVECLTGDELGLLLPVRIGLVYRWSLR